MGAPDLTRTRPSRCLQLLHIGLKDRALLVMAEIKSGSSPASPSAVGDLPPSSPQQSTTSMQTRDEKVEPPEKFVEIPKALERRRSYNSFIEDSGDQEELSLGQEPKRQCRPDSADGFVLERLESVPGPESSREDRRELGASTGHAVEDGQSGNLAESAQSTKGTENIPDPADVNDPNHRVTHLGGYSIVVEEDRDVVDDLSRTRACVEGNGKTSSGSSVPLDPRVDSTCGPTTSAASALGSSASRGLLSCDPDNEYRVVKPLPDKLYEYSDWKDTFTRRQLDARPRVLPTHPQPTIPTSHGLILPFFAIEFKAAAETGGHVWVAGNQCTRGSPACVKAVERLSALLHEHESVHRVDEFSYSISGDHPLADLHISWEVESLDPVVQRVGSFVLTRPDELDSFQQQVRDILGSGKDECLDRIRTALNIILEETTRKTAGPQPDGAHRSGRGRGHGRGRERGRGRGRSHGRGQEQARGRGRGQGRGRGRGGEHGRGSDRGLGRRLS